jgi:F-type H+-transporting ATPase subunit delta
MKTTKRARREARRLYRACVVDGLLDEGRALQVVEGVAGARRHGSLAILSHFQRLVRLDVARHRAHVESATTLPPDLRTSVEAGVARAYGPGVSTSFAENAALIGGMRVKVGSDVYDGSVLAALFALEERF